MLRSRTAFRPPALYFRVFVCFLALLLFSMSLAQAAHHHGPWIGGGTRVSESTRTFDSNDLDSELDCPICMLLHSAVPVFSVQETELHFFAERLPAVEQRTAKWALREFKLFSRPPPKRA